MPPPYKLETRTTTSKTLRYSLNLLHVLITTGRLTREAKHCYIFLLIFFLYLPLSLTHILLCMYNHWTPQYQDELDLYAQATTLAKFLLQVCGDVHDYVYMWCVVCGVCLYFFMYAFHIFLSMYLQSIYFFAIHLPNPLAIFECVHISIFHNLSVTHTHTHSNTLTQQWKAPTNTCSLFDIILQLHKDMVYQGFWDR